MKINLLLCLFFGAICAAPFSLLAGTPIPPFIGDWRGQWTSNGEDYHKKSPQITAQVIGLGNDSYEVIFRGEFQRRANPIFKGVGTFANGELRVSGANWSCVVTDSLIQGSGIYKSKERVGFELKKFRAPSPTIGRAAPDGAVVLFDGTAESLENWMHRDKEGRESAPSWKIVDDYLEIVPKKLFKSAGGDLVSRETFGSCELHMEFWLPYEPDNREQNRANSGVFINDVYEVQILDSYGLVGDWTECGALYKVSPPKVNRCLPPGEWQTYDILYQAPEYNDNGELVKNAVMTVRHNGELIHNQQELFEVTYYVQSIRLAPPPSKPGHIVLQDHSHPIRFRNIWIKPI
jgi:hypothetical protein